MKNRNWKVWFKAAGIRALRTAAQAALGALSGCALISDINWVFVGSTTLIAALSSILMSIAGLPEEKTDGSTD